MAAGSYARRRIPRDGDRRLHSAITRTPDLFRVEANAGPSGVALAAPRSTSARRTAARSCADLRAAPTIASRTDITRMPREGAEVPFARDRRRWPQRPVARPRRPWVRDL